jgi:hypothetical protein
VPDAAVLEFATASGRERPAHAGIIACTFDPDRRFSISSRQPADAQAARCRVESGAESTDACLAMRSAAALLIILPVLWFQSGPLHGQVLEAGGQAVYLDLAEVGHGRWGLGGRIGFDTGALLTVEGELNVFPQDQPPPGGILQALAGLKLGGRSRAYGLFGKLRAGAMRFGQDMLLPLTPCIAIFPPPDGCLAQRTGFALDFGSVVELYPSTHAVIRFDIGTTYIWYRPRAPGSTVRTGNFQLALGAGYRF